MISPMRNQISDWEEALQRLENESTALIEGMTEPQFNWRPGPDR